QVAALGCFVRETDRGGFGGCRDVAAGNNRQTLADKYQLVRKIQVAILCDCSSAGWAVDNGHRTDIAYTDNGATVDRNAGITIDSGTKDGDRRPVAGSVQNGRTDEILTAGENQAGMRTVAVRRGQLDAIQAGERTTARNCQRLTGGAAH